MKKIITVMALSVLLIATTNCNNKKEDEIKEVAAVKKKTLKLKKSDGCTPPPGEDPACLTTIEIQNTHSEQAEWLRVNGDAVCECELFELVKEQHRVLEPVFKNLFSQNPYHANNDVYDDANYVSVPWGDIKKFVNLNSRYGAYFGFDTKLVTENGTTKFSISLKFIKKYTDEASCYSIPLISSLGKDMKDSDTFDFTVADTDGKKVIFKINPNKTGTKFYDISDNPTLVKVKKAF